MELNARVSVLYLKYVRDPIGVFDSDEALKQGMEEIKATDKHNHITDDSFIIKEFQLNQAFGDAPLSEEG